MNLDTYFDQIEPLYAKTLYKKFYKELNKARNKEKVLNTLIGGEIFGYYLCFKNTPFTEYLIDKLYYNYELGKPLEEELADILEYGVDIKTMFDAQTDPKAKRKIMHDQDLRIMKSEKTIIRYFAKYTALQCFMLYLKKEFPQQYQKEFEERNIGKIKSSEIKYSHHPFERELSFFKDIPQNKPLLSNTESIEYNSPITWLNTNETEFVQFVYSLYYAGAIENNNEGITKLVETMAQQFNITLSANWQSNLSNSLSRAKTGYVPQIIKTITKGFEKLCEERGRK